MTPKKFNVVQLAFGGMGPSVFRALNRDDRFSLKAIITPNKGINLYRTSETLEVEKLAADTGVKIIQTDNLQKLHNCISNIKPDLVVIASFNKIIPDDTLKLSNFINIHHGNLPRQRGRANVNWAIINGEPSISISLHEAVPELDAGNIIRQFHCSIEYDDTVGSLYKKLNNQLEQSVADICYDYFTGKISTQEQNHSRATYYPTRLPEDGLIDWHLPRKKIRNIIRALAAPYPGAYTYLDGRKMIIWDADIPKPDRSFEAIVPGRVVKHTRGVGVEVLSGDGPLLITEVQTPDFTGDPAEIIRSTKITLGLNTEQLLERIATLEKCLQKSGKS